MLPVLKKSNPVSQQPTISKYFVPQPPPPPTGVSHKSQRLRNAVARLTGRASEVEKKRTSSSNKGKSAVGQRKRKAISEETINEKVTEKVIEQLSYFLMSLFV